MKIYCVKCYTTHDDSLPCHDVTGQAANEMGLKEKARPSSPEQARRDDAALFKAALLVVLAAIVLVLAGAFLFA